MNEPSRIALCDIAISTHIGDRDGGSQRAAVQSKSANAKKGLPVPLEEHPFVEVERAG
jgi:hypothetical protein